MQIKKITVWKADLGNTKPGDGVRFRGRGIFQTTGRANYAALVTMSRCIAFMLQPSAMNSAASQSSNSGCVGGLPRKPKSLGVDWIAGHLSLMM